MLGRSVGGVPLLLVLLRESDAFLDLFAADLDQATAQQALRLVPQMQPRHQVRLLQFVARRDRGLFLELLCEIDPDALGAEDQVALIVALRQNTDEPAVRQRQ